MNAIELVRRIIRQQTDKIGQPVSNLYGAIGQDAAPILQDAQATWNLALVPNPVPGSLEDFYAQYSNNTNSKYEKLTASFGVTSFVFPKSESGTPYSFLLQGVLRCDGNTVVPLAIAGGSATNPFTVFVDGNLIRTFHGEGNLNLNLSSGKHSIEILGSTDILAVVVPASVAIRSTDSVLTAPTWEDVTGTYSDPVIGVPSVRLRWYSDSSAGGWVVYRRVPELISRISRVTDADPYGKFSVEFSGDYTSRVHKGQDALTSGITIGTVLIDSLDNGNTNVDLQLSSGFRNTNPAWVAQDMYVANWTQVADVRKTGTVSLVEYHDSGVTTGSTYEYAIRAYGLFNNQILGPFSEVQRTIAGDFTAPSSIVFTSGYPKVENKAVTVKFTTPSDSDYAGVRVYKQESKANGTSSGSNTSFTLKDSTKAFGTTDFTNCIVRIYSGTGAGQFALVASNTATQINIDPLSPWTVIPDATSKYIIYSLSHIVTDYGIPNTSDEFQFTVTTEGLYFFRTFDTAGNVQALAAATQWTYTPAVEVPIPSTTLVVTNRSSTGKVESNLLGVTVYSVPAAVEQVLDTFDVPDGTKFVLQYSNTSDASGNTVSTVKKTGAGWAVNAYTGKYVQLTSGILAGKQAKIASNTSTVLSLDVTTWPIPPDSVSFEIWDQIPDKVPVSTMGAGAGSENWSLTDTTTIITSNGRAVFIGPAGKLHEMYLDSKVAVDFRYETLMNRGGLGHFSGSQITGSNLTYRGNSSNANRWEFGITHSSDQIVNIRYRYFSGGAGTWFGLYSGYSWGKNTTKKLIVELDGDIHTFKIADAFGHNELVLGRVTSTAGRTPAATKVGWQLRGNSGDDWIDNTRVLNFGDLVRINYSLSPDHDDLHNSWYTGTVSSGSITELNDQFKIWKTNELKNLRVLITGGPGAGNDRRIVSNTSNQIIPENAFSVAPTSSSTYMVYSTQYQGTEKLQFWTQSDPKFAKNLRFHGERLSTADETEKRILLDANTIPELALTVSKITEYSTISTADLSVQIYPDDDVKRWELYMKKGGYPTINGTTTGVLDPQFKRADLPNTVTQRTIQVGLGTWYCMAVGYDSNGTAGTTVAQTIVIAITGIVDTALSNLSTSKITDKLVRVNWDHTTDVESPSAVAKVNIYATDSVHNDRQLQVSNMEVWREGAGNPNTLFGSGYWEDGNVRHGSPKIYPYTSVIYEIELYLNGLYATTYTTTYSYYGYYLV